MSLSRSIINTLKYTACFNYPLTTQELLYWLMTDTPVSMAALTTHLKTQKLPATLKKFLILKRNDSRLRMSNLTSQRLKQSQKTLNILKKIPTVRYIGLTGSLSMDNYASHSDIDLMLITAPNTLWLTRILVVALLLLKGIPLRRPDTKNAGGTICINLYLDDNDLTVSPDKHNFYVAHEILQIKSLYDAGGYYQDFLNKNSWVKYFYANAYRARSTPTPKVKHFLPTTFIYPINLLLSIIQKMYMSGKITNETVSLYQAFFHPNNPYKGLSSKIKLK